MRKLFIALTLLSLMPPAFAATLVVEHAWIRLLPGDLPLAGYAHVVNHGKHDVTLVAASSPEFKSVQFHRSMDHAGMSEMMRLAQITIPAGQSLAFAPGGYHLMLMGRKHPLQPGQHVTLTLRFADGSQQHLDFTVKGATGQ